VKIKPDKESALGAWSIVCEACPLLPHLKALNMEPRPCVHGIQTNVQGAIPMGQCEFYVKDTLHDDGGATTLECTKEGPRDIRRDSGQSD
jgi:hypothetical protein